MPNTTDRELEVALHAVRQAAALCERVRQRAPGRAFTKADRSPVTVADLGAQALACRALDEAFPGDRIVAEEKSAWLASDDGRTALADVVGYVKWALATPAGSSAARDAAADRDAVLEWIDRGSCAAGPRFWTLDPIDGTKGFLRGDHYAVALALVVDGRVEVAALACPTMDPAISGAPTGGGALFHAVRGGGAWVAPLDSSVPARPVHVCSGADPECARLVESVEPAHADHAAQSRIARSIGLAGASLRMDSQAKYAAVADGRAAVYLRIPAERSPDYRERVWDHAAGQLLVEEAGGRVTDLFGRPLAIGGERLAPGAGVVATNGELHAAALGALAAPAR